MVDSEQDDIENLDLKDEDIYVEVDNHGEANNHGEADDNGKGENAGDKENTGDENDFIEGEGMSYPSSEEIIKLQAQVSTQNITILLQQTPIDGLKKHTRSLEAELRIATNEAPLPEFINGKTLVEPWLDLVDTTMTLANGRPKARVTAANRALDEVARMALYGAKKQAQGPFEWLEFCIALKEAFIFKKSDLELRGHLQSIKCRDRSVQDYAVEFEAAARMVLKPLSDEKMMHTFMKGLPVKLQQARVTGGMTNWMTYKEMKRQVIKTDNIIRTYMFGSEKPGRQPRTEGSGGHGNRPQNVTGGGGWNKRPSQ
ncbi:unnamed protein product [Closterium sp. NIES-65]|nr:unnamed protein product [Closterium sp. NIES-65]